jgi:hypothetical protein
MNDGRFKKGEHASPKTEFKKGENVGKDHPLYKGGLSYFERDKRWIIVGRDKKKFPFARALMECELKRELKQNEIVHHINHDSSDDRIDNLQILTRSEHLLLHEPLKIRWCNHNLERTLVGV